MEKVYYLLFVPIICIILFPLVVQADTPAYVSVSKAFNEPNNHSPLLAGSKIVAGDLSKNEFYILGANESLPAKERAVVQPAVAIQKPAVMEQHPVIKTAALQKKQIVNKGPLLATKEAKVKRMKVSNESMSKNILKEIAVAQKSLQRKHLAYYSLTKVKPSPVLVAPYENKPHVAMKNKSALDVRPSKLLAVKKLHAEPPHKQFTFEVIKLAFDHPYHPAKKSSAKHVVAIAKLKGKRKTIALNRTKDNVR